MSARRRWEVRMPRYGLAVLGACVAAALAGCNVAPARTKADSSPTHVGSSGRLVEAKRCTLTVVILARAQGDAVLNEVAWQAADEQMIDPDLRRALQTNGLRLGRLTGELPSPLAELLRAGPPNQPDVQTIANPSGESALVDASQAPAQPSLNLLLSDPQGQVRGKHYTDAKGFLRVTASHDGLNAVAVRLVPELHHGPVQSGFAPAATGAILVPREFQMTSGQKQETFRELAATVVLQPGQIALIGARADRSGSLGDVLFDKPEGNSDRVRQSLVLIWANRNAMSESPGSRLDVPPALRPVDDAELNSAAKPDLAVPPSAGNPAAEVVPALESSPEPSYGAAVPQEPPDLGTAPGADPFGTDSAPPAVESPPG